jgi:hypothetical protein
VKPVELVGIADHKVNGTPLGAWRPMLKKDLDVSEIHTCEGRRIAFGKRQPKAEFLGIELDRFADVGNCQRRVALLTINGELLAWTRPRVLH